MTMLVKMPVWFNSKQKFWLENLIFERTDNREKISGRIWLLLALTVIYFAVLQTALRHYESGLARDSVTILEQAANWHRTGILVDERNLGNFVPPLALYCFCLPQALGWPQESGTLFLILLFGMTVPPLFFLLIREFCGSNRAALTAAILLASNPYLHDIYNSILRDTVFIPLALLAVLLIMRSFRKPGIMLSCLTGLVAAMVFLTRYEGIVLAPFFAGSIILAKRHDENRNKSLLMILLFALCWIGGIVIPLYCWGVLSFACQVYLWRFLTIFS